MSFGRLMLAPAQERTDRRLRAPDVFSSIHACRVGPIPMYCHLCTVVFSRPRARAALDSDPKWATDLIVVMGQMYAMRYALGL